MYVCPGWLQDGKRRFELWQSGTERDHARLTLTFHASRHTHKILSIHKVARHAAASGVVLSNVRHALFVLSLLCLVSSWHLDAAHCLLLTPVRPQRVHNWPA